MFISISNAIGSTISFGRYVLSLISSFKQRVYADDGEFEAESCLVAQLQELQDIALLQSASLVITPSAVEENKLFSIIPTDGSGDLVVTRATTATRVNSDGLIEVTPYNLLTYSEQFDNSAWTKIGSTITANATIAPNGTTTADKLIEDTSNGLHSGARIGAMASAGTYTLSIYAKVGERTSIAIGNASAGHFAIFDLSLGTVVQGSQGTVTNGAISSIDSNGYYRVSCNITITSLSSISVSLVSTGTTTSYLGNGTSGLFVWGAQLVTGSSAKEYFPTTDRLDVPRLDYTNSSCPSILVEPQRTNLLLRSEEFDNASWAKVNTTITANTSISPSGITNADSMTISSSDSRVEQTTALGSGTYTFSIYVKVLSETTAGNLRLQAVVDSTNVSVSFTPTNEWQRVTATYTATSSITNVRIRGFGFGGTIAIWGAQLEVGSYATSYVPTVASSVTRNADVIFKTGISSLIGQTEGTLFVDVNYEAESIQKCYLNLGTSTSNYIAIGARTNNKIGMEVLNSGVQVNVASTSTYSTSQRLKIAMTYKLNDFKLYVNGILQATDTSGTVPAKAEVYLGSYGNGTFQATDGINSAILWKTALTDQECINLTTI